MILLNYFFKIMPKAINEGMRIRDKIIIAVRYILRPFYKIFGSDFQPYLADLIIKNPDGIFYCRAKTWDALIASIRHEEDLRRFFKLKNGTFVDIGAHIGKYTIRVANQLKNDGKVIAIEPDPDTFKILKNNIERNKLKNVIALNLACWSKNKKIKLYSKKRRFDEHSVVRTISNDFKWVEGRKLDSILQELKIKKVDLVKLDVEGAEFEVLKGMKSTLKTKPRIVFEASSKESLENCKKELSKYGYKISKISDYNYYEAIAK
jgi:FkbM family methyltransferase